MVGLEVDEGTVDGVPGDEPAGLVGCVQFDAFEVGHLHDRMAALMPQPIAADVEGDSTEPLLEAIVVAQGVEPPPGQDGSVVGSVVGRVLGLDRVPQDDARQAVGGIEVSIGQPRELRGRLDPSPLNRAVRGHRLPIFRSVVASSGSQLPSTPTDVTDRGIVLGLARNRVTGRPTSTITAARPGLEARRRVRRSANADDGEPGPGPGLPEPASLR